MHNVKLAVSSAWLSCKGLGMSCTGYLADRGVDIPESVAPMIAIFLIAALCGLAHAVEAAPDDEQQTVKPFIPLYCPSVP
jgi:hypothetical protein